MKKGFTIIETMLVLSISALFAVGLMIGWSVNINRQRYEDAVITLKSDIQDIFSEVENPKNSNGARITCRDTGPHIVVDRNAGSANSRGTTSCILLGKLVSLGENLIEGSTGNAGSSTFIRVADVVGLDVDTSRSCGNNPCVSHVAALRSTKPNIDFGSPNNRRIELQWGANFKNVTDNRGGRLFPFRVIDGGVASNTVSQFLVARSPIDGSVVVLASPSGQIIEGRNNAPDRLVKFIMLENNIVNESRKLSICVRTSGNWWRAGSAVFDRNKVIRIGDSSSSVEIAPLNGGEGTGSMSCGNGVGFDDVLFEERGL